MSETLTQYKAARQDAAASLQSRLEYFVMIVNRADKKIRSGSSGSSNGEGSPVDPNESVLQKSIKCGYSVSHYAKSAFRLRMCAHASCLELHRFELQVW